MQKAPHLEQKMADYHGNYGAPSPDNSHYSDEESGNSRSGGLEMNIKEQDRFLPIANVSRIMKRALPANGKISKEAKETVQECVSEYISFITGEASDKCKREKRKTINGDDLLWAMGTLGFEEYIEPLKVYLHRYRELEGDKSSSTGKQSESEGGAGRAAMGGSYAGSMAGNSQMMPQGYGHQQMNPIMYSPYQQVPMQSNGGSTGGHGGGHMGGS